MIGPKRPLCDAALVAQMQEVAAHLRLTEIAGRALIVGGKAENAADIGGLGVRREAGREPCRRSYAYAGVSSWWSFSRIAPAYAGHTRLPRRPIHAPDGERHLRRSRSVQRLLCNAYRTSHRCIHLAWKSSLSSHNPLARHVRMYGPMQSAKSTIVCYASASSTSDLERCHEEH